VGTSANYSRAPSQRERYGGDHQAGGGSVACDAKEADLTIKDS